MISYMALVIDDLETSLQRKSTHVTLRTAFQPVIGRNPADINDEYTEKDLSIHVLTL